MFPENWRQEIVDAVRTWKHTRYMHKRRVKGVGVDCGGLIYQLFSPYLPLPAFPDDYSQAWGLHNGENEIYLDFIMPFVVEVKKPVPAGLALFQFGRNFSHGALVSDKKTFIHAYGRNSFGTVREDNLRFFSIGEKTRPVKYYDVDPKWLS